MLEVLFKEHKESHLHLIGNRKSFFQYQLQFLMKAKKPIMAAKEAPHAVPSYDEFEPFCKWRREEGRDTLVLDLPDFKKEELMVQINNRGILKVSGERPIDAWRRSKFHKEVEVPKNCNTNGIQARLANGNLYVIMPKIATAAPEQNKPPQVDGSGVDHKTKSEAIQDQARKPALAENKETVGSNKEKMPPSPKVASPYRHKFSKEVTKRDRYVSRMKSFAKTGLNVAVVVAVLAALGAYVFYIYRSTIVEDQFL